MFASCLSRNNRFSGCDSLDDFVYKLEVEEFVMSQMARFSLLFAFVLALVLHSVVSEAEASEKYVRIGDVIDFGSYPQSEDGSSTPMKWRVLDVKEGRALVFSERVIDCREYHSEFVGVDWEGSAIRKWLNDFFFERFFTESEKSAVVLSVLKNPGNPKYGSSGSGDTKDRIFCLSFEEVDRYLSEQSSGFRKPTPYALKKGVNETKGKSWYWLRSPASHSSYASYMRINGKPGYFGHSVATKTGGVCPAMWISIAGLSASRGGGNGE